MSVVKSLSVGAGDMYYIFHNSDNFTVIDCCLSDDNKVRITSEIRDLERQKGVHRFISTHPDEDHIRGLEYFDEQVGVGNFYCVKNSATKPDESQSFKYYKLLRDRASTFYIYKGCSRKWMNLGDEERLTSGINILWPDTSNPDFCLASIEATQGNAFNNLSAVIRYAVEDNASMMWFGDLETKFMESITPHIELPPTPILFAPHHGRVSGKIPNAWLDKLKPKLIVLGEAASRHLHYYAGYHIITQNRAWDITFDLTHDNEVDIYVDNPTYKPQDGFLVNRGRSRYKNYIGTLIV